MTKNVTSLPPETPLNIIVTKMVEQQYSCIIISKNKTPVGIVTERDLVNLLSRGADGINLSSPVSNLMSSNVFRLNENNSLFDAMVISRAEKVRHFPVVNNNEHIVGLITSSDLVDAYFQVIETQSEIIEQAVLKRTSELQQLNDDLHALSMEDHLMIIGNRRAMEVDLGHTHNASIRYNTSYSILLMDLDFFKLFNDSYGHLAGDVALKSVAETLKTNMRSSDRLYRYGGEEVLIVLPQTNAEEAKVVAQKLVDSIENSAISHEKSKYNYLTISCGGTCSLNNKDVISSWQDLVERADKNLYHAKKNGRNRSVVC